MTTEYLRTLFLRDLDTVEREVLAYPDDETLWALPDGAPNSGGTLALHLAGNLHHYLGAVLGGVDYVRDREEEFAARGLTRGEVAGRVAAVRAVADQALSELAPERLTVPFHGQLSVGEVATGLFLMHLATHLAYHLGQLDYHRRLVTGDARGVDAQAISALVPAS